MNVDKDTVRTCQRCSVPVSRAKKYCGLNNYTTHCKTCQKAYKQKCRGRVNRYCSKKCQANDPELIESANEKREQLGYLTENAKNTLRKVQEKYGVITNYLF